MTVRTEISWSKIIMAALLPVIGFAGTSVFTIGQMSEKFAGLTNKVTLMDDKVDKIKDRVDTIQVRQQQNQFNNQLQFQAIWNAIEKRQTSIRQKGTTTGTVSQRYVNGQLTYVVVK